MCGFRVVVSNTRLLFRRVPPSGKPYTTEHDVYRTGIQKRYRTKNQCIDQSCPHAELIMRVSIAQESHRAVHRTSTHSLSEHCTADDHACSRVPITEVDEFHSEVLQSNPADGLLVHTDRLLSRNWT